MDVEAIPPLEPSERRALVAALGDPGVEVRAPDPYAQPWRLAGLRESADDEEADVAYAFSPRRTRGATRA